MFTKNKLFIKKILLTCSLFLFGLISTLAQEVTGKISHFISKNGIQNVAIQTNLNTGTVSNIDGNYSISVKNVAYLTFSRLGFKTKTLSTIELAANNYQLDLEELSTLLDEFELTIPKITLDSLLIKTQKSMLDNYIDFPTTSKFYASENQVFDIKKINLDFVSSSLLDKKNEKRAKKELQDFADDIKNSHPNIPEVFLATLESITFYSEAKKNNFPQKKVSNILAIKPIDSTKNFSLKKVENDTKQLILKYVNQNKTYKIKTGLFTIEDSAAISKTKKNIDSFDIKNTFTPFKPINYVNVAFNRANFFKNNDANNFLNTKYYKHNLLNTEFLKDKTTYVIQFLPKKSSAKYQGKIYINPRDYTISKITYDYAKGKRGEHLNLKLLLGVKFSENQNTGILYFQKNKESQYYLAYFKENIGRYAYANRPFKFIENSEEKNKIKLSMKLEFNMNEITEVYFSDFTLKEENEFSTPLKKGDYMKRLEYVTDKKSMQIVQKRQKELIEFLNEYE